MLWPSPLQERLLVVALADPEPAAAAWDELRPRFSFEQLETGSVALLPLVYRALVRAGIDDPLLPRLKGVYRKSWVTGRLLLARTRESAALLDAAGVHAVFLEGAVLATRFYPELGLRRSSAVDVLVDVADAEAARATLGRAGWVEPPGSEPGPVLHLFDEHRNACVLRTRLAADFVPRSSREPADLQTELVDLDGTAVHVLAPTDVLLSSCVLHARAGDGRNVQWIGDAKMVLGGGGIDWDRLLEIGSEHQQALRLRDALGYLAGLPGPAPPRDVLERLERRRAPWRERLGHRLASGSLGGGNATALLLGEHLAQTAPEPWARALASFPARLRDRWGLTRRRHLPLAAGRRAIRRLGSRRNEVS